MYIIKFYNKGAIVYKDAAKMPYWFDVFLALEEIRREAIKLRVPVGGPEYTYSIAAGGRPVYIVLTRPTTQKLYYVQDVFSIDDVS